jgi:hypothetical protein
MELLRTRYLADLTVVVAFLDLTAICGDGVVENKKPQGWPWGFPG